MSKRILNFSSNLSDVLNQNQDIVDLDSDDNTSYLEHYLKLREETSPINISSSAIVTKLDLLNFRPKRES